MYHFMCKYCNKKFNSPNKDRKFCSKDCYCKSRKGHIKSKETREKLRKAATGRDNSCRGPAISKAKSQRAFTKEEVLYIKQNIKKYDWITNTKIFIKQIKLDSIFEEKIKKTRISEVKKLLHEKEIYNKDVGIYTFMFPLEIQKWPYQRMQNFKKDAIELYWKKCFKKYKIGKKTFLNLCKFYKLKYNIDSGIYIYKFTKPERIINNFLLETKINFKREKYINNMRWRVDFLIDNLYVIEVNGDYWHGNPEIYNKEDLNEMQKRNKINDVNKKNWLIKNNYKYLVLWEADIYNKLDLVKTKIFNFIKE